MQAVKIICIVYNTNKYLIYTAPVTNILICDCLKNLLLCIFISNKCIHASRCKFRNTFTEFGTSKAHLRTTGILLTFETRTHFFSAYSHLFTSLAATFLG